MTNIIKYLTTMNDLFIVLIWRMKSDDKYMNHYIILYFDYFPETNLPNFHSRRARLTFPRSLSSETHAVPLISSR